MGALTRFRQSVYDTVSDLEEAKVEVVSGWKETLPGVFMPNQPTIDSLKSGYYRVMQTNTGEAVFELRPEPTSDELMEIPGSQNTQIIDDIIEFVNKSDVYKQMQVVHKRGVLLEGPPGSGKTATAQLVAKHMTKHHNAVVIVTVDIAPLTACLQAFRKVEPQRLLIVLLEEFDQMTKYSLPETLSLLDGENQVNNIVYIATTNHVNNLPASLVHRPSRFDEVLNIPMPNEVTRASYITTLTKRVGLSVPAEDWVKDTEGFSLAHLRELVISQALGRDYLKTVERLKNMLGDNFKEGTED